MLGEKLVLGELTVLQGRRVYTVTRTAVQDKASEAIDLVIAD